MGVSVPLIQYYCSYLPVLICGLGLTISSTCDSFLPLDSFVVHSRFIQVSFKCHFCFELSWTILSKISIQLSHSPFSVFTFPILSAENRILVYYASPSLTVSNMRARICVLFTAISLNFSKRRAPYCVLCPIFKSYIRFIDLFSHQKALSCFTFIQSNDCETEGLEPTDSKAHDSDPHKTAKLKGQVKKVYGGKMCVCVWWWRNIYMCAKTVCVRGGGGIQVRQWLQPPKVKILYKSYIFNVKGLKLSKNPFCLLR